MIHLYPANKMENLLLLLNKISQLSPLGVFNQEVIVVQNAGMQHWLNLAIAKERGISMNIGYALPAQFLWKLMRTLASDDKVPEQSPYSREVLCWRIYQLLITDNVVNDDDFSQATRYWLGEYEPDELTERLHDNDNNANLKRYQLAAQLADLYEQYLIFRPQWLDNWQQGIFNIAGLEHREEREHKWQGKLWQYLIAQTPYNPVELLNDAIANISSKKSLIPARISFFGLNTMAPMWLSFIEAISEHVDVHFFHLNPCYSYWGDIVSEKTALKRLAQWSSDLDNIEHFVGNPLLANLGQQGREFISLLQDISTIDVDVFEKAVPNHVDSDDSSTDRTIHNTDSPSVLHQIQNDILQLEDARQLGSQVTKQSDPTLVNTTIMEDNSIVIASCHSALREVQALHDYLLHTFNDDKSLTPKDILVMCPQIETYAPYVNAVFSRGWQDLAGDIPPLPCSIADRSAKDSDPLVAGFTELLALPDSRFSVSQLMAFLRLPAIAAKFSISTDDLVKISQWLTQASVHWGLDVNHKQTLLGSQASSAFTWHQGLSRLLRGFAFDDNEAVFQSQLLINVVEGQDAVLLGRLMFFIEQLQAFSSDLKRARSAAHWQQFLLTQLDELFSRVDDAQQSYEHSLLIIEHAIAGLVEHCYEAKFTDDICLDIVVDYLNQHFSQGDASKQFMVGQVTFCSMLPMRSIPFKVIAVLGLNDGEFPRQRQPLGFDLMSLAAPQLGDRSRRGDDRYLFLEAIISARKSLYLSYQGRNIKNNNVKQPSLVLKELMEYLTQGYGWQFDNQSPSQQKLYHVAMQAFSENNYQGQWASFDPNWLALSQYSSELNCQSQETLNNNLQKAIAPTSPQCIASDVEPNQNDNGDLTQIEQHSVQLNSQQIIRYFQHPSRAYAQQQLNLNFDTQEVVLDDVEPFSVNALQSYFLREALLKASFEQGYAEQDDRSKQQSTAFNNATEQVILEAKLSGKFPDLPTNTELFSDYVDDSQQFHDDICLAHCDNPQQIECSINIDIAGVEVLLTSQLAVKETKLVHYRSSSAKAKDKFSLYLHQLIIQCWQQQFMERRANVTPDESQHILSIVTETVGIYFNTKSQKIEQYTVAAIPDATTKLITLLTVFFKGQEHPLLLNADIAEHIYKQKRGKPVEMTQSIFELLWQGDSNTRGLSEDDYLRYFWPQCPEFCVIKNQFDDIYLDMYELIKKQPTTQSAKKTVTVSAKKAPKVDS